MTLALGEPRSIEPLWHGCGASDAGVWPLSADYGITR